jgi:hypothetical protein
MSMSIRAFSPLMRLVIVGVGRLPGITDAAPPSTFVFVTTVTSACTTAEHTANTRSVADQRFIFEPPDVDQLRRAYLQPAWWQPHRNSVMLPAFLQWSLQYLPNSPLGATVQEQAGCAHF